MIYSCFDSLWFIAVTRNQQTARQIHLHRGCYPFWYPEPRGIESHQWQTDVSASMPFLNTDVDFDVW